MQRIHEDARHFLSRNLPRHSVGAYVCKQAPRCQLVDAARLVCPALPVSLSPFHLSRISSAPATEMSSAVPAGWLMKESRTHPGRIYYYNTITKESVWEMPTEPAVDPKADAGKADEIRCSHILVKHKNSRRPSSWRCPEITISKAEAITRLIEFRKVIIADESQFEALARKFSDCGSANKGGDLGFFARGVMQRPFEETAFSLRVGELSGIVETDSGVHLILRTG